MKQKWTRLFNQNQSYEQQMISNILEKLNFQLSFEIIHVVGTNGKGSVAHFLSHNLQTKYRKVGLFTSPHLVSPYERIQINGKHISASSFWKITQQIPNSMNFFAKFYLVAMIYFMEQQCDIVILEAGIGGRLDATGAIKGKWAILTSVDYDHCELLGDSLVKIAREKYLIKNPAMIFYLPSHLNQVIKNDLQDKNTFILNNKSPNFAHRNFLLGKEFLKQQFAMTNFQKVAIRGRHEIFIHNDTWTIFDVAHNEAGIKALLKLLVMKKRPFAQVVIMIKKNKDISNLRKIFQDYNVYFYQQSEQFYDFSGWGWTKIANLKMFFKNQKQATLYLGSFVLIGELYGYKK